jgi:hypothetical protein
MNVVTREPVPPLALGLPVRLSTHEQVFWRGILLMALVLLAFGGIQWIEKHVVGSVEPHLLVENGLEAAVRYVTLPHFILAFVFSVTAARNQTWRRRGLLGGLLLAGAVLCWGFWSLAVHLQGWVLDARAEVTLRKLLILPYFLWHEMRDEAFFYRRFGTAPDRHGRPLALVVSGLIGLTLLAFLVIFGAAFALGLTRGFEPALVAAMPRELVAAGVATTVLVAIGGAFLLLRRYARGESLTVSGALRRHAPLFRIYLALVLVNIAGLAITGRGSTLALLHVCVWYVFLCHTLAERPPDASGARWWPWLRGTVGGFRVMHHGLVVLLVGLGIVWVYALEQQGALEFLLSPRAFYYWTIVHITLSFLPR